MLGLIVAFAGVLLAQLSGIPHFDGAASVIIGLILAGTAIWLAYETKGLLIGENANQLVVQGIRQIAGSYAQVEQVNEVLTMHMGPDFILVNISVKFVPTISANEVEVTVAGLDKEIKQSYPNVKRLFVEAEANRAGAPGAPAKARTGEGA